MMDQADHIEELRLRIDAIDRDLLRLIEKRAETALAIGALKSRGKDGAKHAFASFYRPSREMQVLRKILALRQSAFPEAALLRIWREIIGNVLQMQSPFTLAYGASGGKEMTALARDHFGVAVSLRKCQTVRDVLAFLEQEEAALGLFHLPGHAGDKGWPWLRSPLRVLGRLPLFAEGPGALVIGRSVTEPTGEDESLFRCANLDPSFSVEALLALFNQHGLTARVLDQEAMADGTWHGLVCVNQFLAEESKESQLLSSILPKGCWWLGAYARPFSE